MIDRLHSLDQEITLAINSVHGTLSDSLWVFMSDKKVWVPLYIMAIVLLFRKLGWKKALVSIVFIMLSIVETDQIGNLVKDSVCRLRPCYNSYMLDNGLRMLESRGHYFGFYSAHAADAFGFVTCATICLFRMDRTRTNRRYLAIGLCWAAMVSISRVFVGKHFFGDILAGALVGCAIGYLMGILAVTVSRRFIMQPGCTASGLSLRHGTHTRTSSPS